MDDAIEFVRWQHPAVWYGARFAVLVAVFIRSIGCCR